MHNFKYWQSIAALSLVLGACGSDKSLNCTAELRASVSLTVVDSSNNALPDVSIDYQVNGDPIRTKTCGPEGTCGIGEEIAGEFSITASKQGYSSHSVSVTVSNADLCHVRTEILTITLQSSVQSDGLPAYSEDQLNDFVLALTQAAQQMPEGQVVHTIGVRMNPNLVELEVDIGATESAQRIIAASGVPPQAVRIVEGAGRPRPA